MKKNVFKLQTLVLLLVLASCGGDTDSTSGSGTSSGGSSTATGSCSSVLSDLSGTGTSSASYSSTGSLSSITQSENCSSSVVGDSLSIKRAAVTYNPTWDVEAKEIYNEALASGDNDDIWPSCAVKIPKPDKGEDPACFGPQLYFQYHLDGDTQMSQNCDSSQCALPIGDLGLWSESEGDSGEACAAAKMNSDIQYVSGFSDMAKVVQSLVECLENEGTITRPTSGAETITSEVNAAILNEDLEFSSVVWSKASDAYTIVLQAGESGADGTISIKTDTTATPNVVNIWGFFGDKSDKSVSLGSKALAFSLYGTKNGTAKNMKFISAIFEGTTPDTTTNGDVFDANNMLKLDSSWSMDHRTILANDAGDESSDKYMKYSWVAGNGAPLTLSPDSYSRTFMASINAAETEGVAYYGYGYGGSGGSAPEDRMKITNFICNWTGPNNNQNASTAGPDKAQKQVLSKNESGVWVASESFIDYAPTRSCANDNNDGSSSGSADDSIDTRLDSVDSSGLDHDGQGSDFGVASSAFTYGVEMAMGEEVKIAADDVELVDLTAGADATNMSSFDSMTDPTE
jgi:hypothetical protein